MTAGPSVDFTISTDTLEEALTLCALLATVIQVNPRAAHAFASDSEIGLPVPPHHRCRRARSVLPSAALGRRRRGRLLRSPHALATQRLAGYRPPPALRRVHTPAHRQGPFDYVFWSSAVDYRDTMPEARMVYLSGTGHHLFAERTAAFFTTVKAFHAEGPLPLPIETRVTAPPDYQGPA